MLTRFNMKTDMGFPDVLVCSFDMEDAMILNKSSVERGLFHGCVYKTKIIDAAPSGSRAVSGSM